MSVLHWIGCKPKSQTIGLISVIATFGLLMAACQPAAAPQTQAQSQGQGQGQGQGFGNGQRQNFQMQPAPELPTDAPAVRGVIVSHTGNMLTVREGGFGGGSGGGFGGGNGTPRAAPQGTPRARPTQGPAVEIQVDVSNATVYEDTTFANLNGQPPSGTIQQTVQVSSLDKIPDNSRVTIWGDVNGNQAVAKVVVFTQLRGPQNGGPQGGPQASGTQPAQ